MLKLLKMNVYRMFHTRSLLILIMIMVVIGFCSASLMYDEMAYGEDTTAIEADAEEETETLYIGYSSAPEYETKPVFSNVLKMIISDIASCLPLLLIGIGAILFIGAESKTGFTKNLVSYNVSKSKVYMAKNISYWLAAFAITIAYCLSAGITLCLACGSDMEYNMELVPEFLKYFGVQFLLTVAYVSGLSLLNTVLNSTALSVTFCSLSTTGFLTAMICIPLELKFDIEINKYTIYQNMLNLDFGISDKDFSWVLGVGIVTFLVYNILGNIWVSKRDVV